jgi:hypothetical protein
MLADSSTVSSIVRRDGIAGFRLVLPAVPAAAADRLATLDG